MFDAPIPGVNAFAIPGESAMIGTGLDSLLRVLNLGNRKEEAKAATNNLQMSQSSAEQPVVRPGPKPIKAIWSPCDGNDGKSFQLRWVDDSNDQQAR